MTQPDFRALCAELLAATQLYTGQNPAASEMSSVEITEKLMDAMAATVAALATPPPESPSEKEIELFIESIRMPWILEQISRATDPDPDFDVVIVRAALERWGRWDAFML